MNAALRVVKAPEPASAPAADALRAHREQIARLNSRVDDTGARVAKLEALLRDADTARSHVATLRDQRHAEAGRQIARGQQVDVAALDRDIADAIRTADTAGQALAALDGRDSVAAAIEFLNQQQRQHSTEADILAKTAPRLQHAAAAEQLAALAPAYQKAISDFVDVLVQVAGAARAVDQLAPRAGAPQVASGFAHRVEIGKPAHEAYDILKAISYGDRIAARTRELLESLGAGAVAR